MVSLRKLFTMCGLLVGSRMTCVQHQKSTCVFHVRGGLILIYMGLLGNRFTLNLSRGGDARRGAGRLHCHMHDLAAIANSGGPGGHHVHDLKTTKKDPP